MMEKAIASGISANATIIPARISPLTFENHSFLVLIFANGAISAVVSVIYNYLLIELNLFHY